MFITFLGNNGVGKSTLARRLESSLKNGGHKILYIEEFEYTLLAVLKRVLGKSNVTQLQSDVKKNNVTFLYKTLPYLIWLDLTFQYLKVKIFYRKYYVIRERYFLDFLATWEELGISNRFIRYLYLKAPKSDLTLYIHINPEIAFARRNEQGSDWSYELNFYKLKDDIYKGILDRNGISKRVFKVENLELNSSLETILKVIDLRERLLRVRLISISGIDGAGKSTTVEKLDLLLNSLNVHFKSRHFYYNYIILKCLKKLSLIIPGRGVTKSKEKVYKESIENERLAKGQKSVIWAIFVLLDSLLQVYFTLLTSRGLIIFDRYYYDYFVSFKFLNVNRKKVESLSRLFPQPDRAFFQLAKPEILFSRKPEHSMVFFNECYDYYCKLANEVPNSTLLDSSDLSPDDILNQLLLTI